jgi:hypothetical protein
MVIALLLSINPADRRFLFSLCLSIAIDRAFGVAGKSTPTFGQATSPNLKWAKSVLQMVLNN